MKVYIYYGLNLEMDDMESILDFMANYASMGPAHNPDMHMIEYTGVDMATACMMIRRVKLIRNVDITCEKEPQDYEPLIFIEKNDKIRTSMAFKREASGAAILSMQVTTSQVPIEIIGELTATLDNEKLKDMKRWINEVME